MERTESMESSSSLQYPFRSNTLSPSSKVSDQAIINSLSSNYYSETDRSNDSYSPEAVVSSQGCNHGYTLILLKNLIC